MSDSDNQKDLLSQWLNRREDEDQNVSPAATSGPLTPGQERLLILQELYDGNPFYHYTELYSFHGDFDLNHLIKSFEDVIAKHDILRTTFSWEDGASLQTVNEDLAAEIKIIENVPRDTVLMRQSQVEEARRPLDIHSSSPVRLSIFKIDTDRADFLITMHHIVTDKWSMRQFRDDWAYFYKTRMGESAVEPSLGSRYLDYAIEKKKSSSPDSLSFWKEHLKGMPTQMPLETDFVRPKRLSYSGKFVSRKITQETGEKALELATSLGVTPYAFFLSIFKYWLARQTQSTDIVVGTPISNRNKEELENSIGFFNETVILRTEIQAEKPIDETISKVHDSCLKSFSHADVPFEELVKILQPARQENLNPLFQVMFLYHDVPDQPVFHPDISLEYEPFDLGVAKFDLTLYISNDHGQLTSIVEYSDELFSSERMEIFLESYHHILDQIVASPNGRWNELSHHSPYEKEMLQKWSTGPKVRLENESVLDWLQNPDSDYTQPAVWSDGKEWSYEDLVSRSRALSQALIQNGLSPGEGVGLVTHPGIEMMIGITGILLAGGFYIPLDPTYPKERLQFMLEDSGARFLVSGGAALSESEIQTGLQTLVINDLDPLHHVALPSISSDQPAYMIYTSGSTGNPKGVMVKHKQLLNSTAARLEYYGDDAPRYMLLSSFSFDSSVAGIFWCLHTGGCLILTPRRIEQDPHVLGQLIEASGATHTLMLPSLYQVLLELIPTSQMRTLEKVIVAGEHCGSPLIQQHHELLPGTQLYNEYGPTEATVWSSVGELLPHQSSHIGEPILNTKTWILDDADELAPIGVPGELVIAGANVTGGYHNRPELTANKFVQIESLEDSNLYRTGDLVKWNNSGQIIFLGRKDDQLKLRGHRIELGEISRSLKKQLGINKAIVLIDDASRLVSFYSGSEKTESELKSELSKSLPNYMIPEYITHVSEFPFLPNGKIDKKQLLTIKAEAATESKTNDAPQNEKQSILWEIWTKVLDRADINVRDNFFSIGGDSIKSIQVVAQLREKGFKLRPEDIFTFQTIEALSEQLQSLQEVSVEPERIAGEADWLPIHDWFFALHRNAPQHWGQAYRIDLQKPCSQEEIKALYNHLIQNHPGLRSTFKVDEQMISIKPHKDQSIDLISIEETTSYLEEWMAAANIEKDILFRCAFDEKTNAMVLSGHHLVVDAISWNIILNDADLFLRQKTNSLSSHTILDWCRHFSKSYQKSEIGQKNISGPVYEEGQVQTCKISIPYPPSLFEDGNALSLTKEEYALALAGVIHNYLSSNSELYAVIESNGRTTQGTDIDLSNAVGWFTTMFETRFTALEKSQTQKDYLTNLKEAFRLAKKNMFAEAANTVNSFLQNSDRFLFNFLGNKVSTDYESFKVEFIKDGVRSSESERNYKAEFNVWDTNESFEFHCSLVDSEDVHQKMEDLESQINSISKELSDWLLGKEQEYTPGDFTDVDIDQDDLDALLGQFE